MQCDAIRHTVATPAGAPHDLEVVARTRAARSDLVPDARIQDVFRHLAQDAARTRVISDEVAELHRQGRKVLVLTERMEQLEALQAALSATIPALFVLHGRMSGKQRAALIAGLDALPPQALRALLATGKLAGKVLITRPWTPWCWPCRFRGRARCSSTPAACTGSWPARPMYASSTSWTPAIRRRCACGASGNAAIGRWGITWRALRGAAATANCCSNLPGLGGARFAQIER